MDTTLLRNQPPFVLDRETAPAMWLVGTLWLFLATGNQTGNHSCFIEQVMGAGLGPPAHRHPQAIEGFFVLEGVVVFHVDGKDVRAEAGTLLHISRMQPHTFTVESPETRVLNFYVPAGADMHVMFLARPAEEPRRPTMDEGPPPRSPEQNKIMSRLYGSSPFTALPFAVPPNGDLLATVKGQWPVGAVVVNRPSDGRPTARSA